jgi:SSS family solute:Na+ symporter
MTSHYLRGTGMASYSALGKYLAGLLLLAHMLTLPALAEPTDKTPEPKLLFRTAEATHPAVAPGTRALKGTDTTYLIEGSRVRLSTKEAQWNSIDLGVEAAAPALRADELLLAGGLQNGQATGRVQLVREGKIINLPDLPEPRIGARATVLGDALYVIGGRAAPEFPPTDSVFRLPLPNFVQIYEDPEWETCDPLPGPPRTGFSVLTLYEEIHVMGGVAEDGPVALAFGYREEPVDGFTDTGWRPLASSPIPLDNPVLIPTGQVHMVVIDRRSARSLIFHNVTDTWLEETRFPGEASAILGVLPVKKDVFDKGRFEVLLPAASMEMELPNVTRTLSTLDYVVIGIFFLAMAGIGVYFARKQNNSEEFALGGRKVIWWASAISMFATAASSISFMAIPAQIFRTNLVWILAPLLAIPVSFVIQAYFVFPTIRRLNLTSVYQYLEMRFDPSLRMLASAQCIAFQLLGRMSVVMLLPALAISAVTGMDVFWAVAIMGFLTTIYTAVGGFEAVIWTDVTQGFLMVAGCLLMGFYAISSLPGGWSDFVEINMDFERFGGLIWSWDASVPTVWIILIGPIILNLAFASDQPTMQRCLATPEKDMKRFAAMFQGFAGLIAILGGFAGLAIFAYFQTQPEQLSPTMANDQVIPLYIIQRMPAGLAGLIIAALFAASMSTLSSSMNSVATISCEDFYRRFKKNTTDRERLLFMKLGSLVIGVIGTGSALYMASMNVTSLLETWQVVVALIGGGFLGIYILGIFTRRTNTVGVIAGALASIVATILLRQFDTIHFLGLQSAAVLTCIVVGYGVSLIFPAKPRDLTGLTVWTPARKETKPEPQHTS